MSENLLQLIPQQPAYIPEENAARIAEDLLKSQVSKNSEVFSRVSEEVRFVDAGTNFESISCPVCGKQVSDEWWSDAMQEAHKSKFRNLDVIVPCCHSQTTLNLLNYKFPQGFARFVLTARNPGISEFDELSRDKLERIIGCQLRVVWTRY